MRLSDKLQFVAVFSERRFRQQLQTEVCRPVRGNFGRISFFVRYFDHFV